jgi:hypothetical protein
MSSGLFSWSRKGLTIAVAIFVTKAALADSIVFDNLLKPQLDPQGDPIATNYPGEFGDEITLGGTARTITSFLFYYYADFVAKGDEGVKIRFYQNDVPYSLGTETVLAPGTLIYESPWTFINSTKKKDPPYGSVSVVPVGPGGKPVVVPDDFTYTVQFKGVTMAVGNEAGLLYYDLDATDTSGKKITTGTSYDDFWQRGADGKFQLLTLNPVPPYVNPKSNFGVLLTAVPEPGVWVVGTLGALVWIAGLSCRRKTQ